MTIGPSMTRRQVLAALAGTLSGLTLRAVAEGNAMQRRPIPATGEALPVIGLGTSDEFERMPADGGRELRQVLETLLGHGGSLVDTAPGYGNAEQVLGELTESLRDADQLFLSTKVRTRGRRAGRESLERSLQRLDRDPLDLIMVHSLVDAETQLDNLQAMKEEGRVRYIGITTSRSRDFGRMESLIRSRDMDFIQVNYSPLEPEAAERVIPAARDRGIAVMVNRAFGNGNYFRLVRGHELPDWAAEFDCDSWAQLSLKWILGNPDVTCSLAATSNPRHMADNTGAGFGEMPDAAMRQRIARLLRSL